MIYVIHFSVDGVPQSGLTPAITIYKQVADGVDVEPVPEIAAIGGGGYKFSAVPAAAIYVEIDGGAGLADAERYKALQITPHDGDLDAAVSARPTRPELATDLLQALWARWEFDRSTGAFRAYDPEGNLAVSGTIIATTAGVVRSVT